MADLALRLKVFIASPSDVRPERDIAHEAILELQEASAEQLLLIQPYRWEEEVAPTYRPVQQGINQQLRRAELTIAILWSTLGTVARSGLTGTLEELSIAGERVTRGYSDDLFLYFKIAHREETDPAKVEEVAEFRRRSATDGAFYREFETPEQFADMIRADLGNWIKRWHGVPSICHHALSEAAGGAAPRAGDGENRLTNLKRLFDPTSDAGTARALGAIAVNTYQDRGPHLWSAPISGHALEALYRSDDADLAPLVERGLLVFDGSSLRFHHEEFFYFYCAYGLIEAVSASEVRAVERRQYINPVHQYLKALAHGEQRTRLVSTLRAWLLSRDGKTDRKPVARNFAAYVLGMLEAVEAHEDMARAIREDMGEDVQIYCIMSLGRMRVRVHLPTLVSLFSRTPNAHVKTIVAQAVTRMVGVADYPM